MRRMTLAFAALGALGALSLGVASPAAATSSDPMNGNSASVISTECSTGLNGSADIAVRVHKDDRYVWLGDKPMLDPITDKRVTVEYGADTTFPMTNLAPGVYSVTFGDKKKIEEDDPRVEFVIAECVAAKAPTARCNIVSFPASPGDVMYTQQGTNRTFEPGKKYRVAGKSATFMEDAAPGFELTGDTFQWTLTLTTAACNPKPQYVTMQAQVDQYHPQTAKQAACVTRFANAKALEWRGDRCMWGTYKTSAGKRRDLAIHQIVKIKVRKGATRTEVLKAINAQTGAVGNVSRTWGVGKVKPGDVITIAWKLGPHASKAYPWARDHSESQARLGFRFIHRG